jgi:hypothetical protein
MTTQKKPSLWQRAKNLKLRNLFVVDRPLTEQEKRDHLLTGERSRSKPDDQATVIQMNSTFLDCTDKLFAERGLPTTFCIFFIVLFSVSLINMTFSEIVEWSGFSSSRRSESIWFILALWVMFLPTIWLTWKVLREEAFRLTHYPTRFNRKTRMVHWFRFDDGTVQSEPWDNLYFTLAEWAKSKSWEVLAHRLGEDGKTVLETFALPFSHVRDSRDRNPVVWSQWEFVRRYMEEPDQLAALADQVKVVQDVAGRRENFLDGVASLERVYDSPLHTPLSFIYGIGRFIASLTCKIPVWPAEIEAQCKIEPNDPYIRNRQVLQAIHVAQCEAELAVAIDASAKMPEAARPEDKQER